MHVRLILTPKTWSYEAEADCEIAVSFLVMQRVWPRGAGQAAQLAESQSSAAEHQRVTNLILFTRPPIDGDVELNRVIAQCLQRSMSVLR